MVLLCCQKHQKECKLHLFYRQLPETPRFLQKRTQTHTFLFKITQKHRKRMESQRQQPLLLSLQVPIKPIKRQLVLHPVILSQLRILARHQHLLSPPSLLLLPSHHLPIISQKNNPRSQRHLLLNENYRLLTLQHPSTLHHSLMCPPL